MLLLTGFDLIALAVDCVVSGAVVQPLACDLVICVLNWCKRISDNYVIRPEMTLCG